MKNKTGVLFMMTKTPDCKILGLGKEEASIKKEEEISLEIPLQKMFDDMMVFITKDSFN